MTPDKLREIVRLYRKCFDHVEPVRCSSAVPEETDVDAHLAWMLERLQEEEDFGKAQRWLGFIQGALWTQGFFTIEQMREHNRSIKEKS